MFTGIIQYVGRVESVRREGSAARLRIELGPLCDGLAEGDSVAVNGLCLTAVRIDAPRAEFDVVAESLARSTLGELRGGEAVNLERALPADGRFDGHIVQGHVDGTATLERVDRTGGWEMILSAETELTGQMVPKGSIAVDGVSLTLAGVEPGRFRVALIPETLERTTLGELQPGRRVNVELDILGKYVKRYLRQMLDAAPSGGLTLEKLREQGFA